MNKRMFYRCSICGNLFGVIKDSGVNPVCCDQKMDLLEPNSTDANPVAHTPALERDGKNLKVVVGETVHPMIKEHYIEWIAVAQGEHTQRIALHPEQAPEAEFLLADADEAVSVYAYCNLHGLWLAEA